MSLSQESNDLKKAGVQRVFKLLYDYFFVKLKNKHDKKTDCKSRGKLSKSLTALIALSFSSHSRITIDCKLNPIFFLINIAREEKPSSLSTLHQGICHYVHTNHYKLF